MWPTAVQLADDGDDDGGLQQMYIDPHAHCHYCDKRTCF